MVNHRRRGMLVEVLAIGLVVALRAGGMPLPAWPFLILIAAGFSGRPWRKWASLGSAAPPARVVGIAALLGVAYQFFTIFVEGPFLAWLFNEPETLPAVDGLVGNVPGVLVFLVLIMVFSVGEELAFRGYLLARIRKWTGGSTVGTAVALALSSVAFGAMHTWQNLPGMTGTMISGVVFGVIFLAAGADVRAPIAAHLATNVTALVLVFFGLFIS